MTGRRRDLEDRVEFSRRSNDERASLSTRGGLVQSEDLRRRRNPENSAPYVNEATLFSYARRQYGAQPGCAGLSLTSALARGGIRMGLAARCAVLAHHLGALRRSTQ